MIQVKCIRKFRDKYNNIYGYRLKDQQNNIKDVKSENLKKAIAAKQIQVINLTLTSDNRLVDKQDDTQQDIKLDNTQINNYLCKNKFHSQSALIIGYIKNSGLQLVNSPEYKETECTAELSLPGEKTLKMKFEIQIDLNTAQKSDGMLSTPFDETDNNEGISVLVTAISENDEELFIDFDTIHDLKSLDELSGIVKDINEFKEIVSNISNAKDILKLAYFIAKHQDEIETCMERVTLQLEKLYRISTHDLVQQRIDKIVANTPETNRLKQTIILTGPNMDVSINNTDELRRFLSIAIYGEALLGEKITDITQIIILNDETEHIREFNIDTKLHVSESEIDKDQLIKDLASYKLWKTDVCNNAKIMISFGYNLSMLDTFLGEQIGIELLKTDDKLIADFEKRGIFSFEDVIIDISTEKAYNALKNIVSRFSNDYQFNDFVDELLSQINLYK